mgnify:FL=1
MTRAFAFGTFLLGAAGWLAFVAVFLWFAHVTGLNTPRRSENHAKCVGGSRHGDHCKCQFERWGGRCTTMTRAEDKQ